jgi:BlaI family transcriptional regulator, penicillinase repressor
VVKRRTGGSGPSLPVTFTERELDVMSVLWREGSGTVAEVREALEDELGYTSVLKILQILTEKGHVRHEPEGRAYRYVPTVAPEEAGRSALARIVNKIFQGSAELTLARLVEDRSIPPDELDRMRKLLDEATGEAGGSPGGEE